MDRPLGLPRKGIVLKFFGNLVIKRSIRSSFPVNENRLCNGRYSPPSLPPWMQDSFLNALCAFNLRPVSRRQSIFQRFQSSYLFRSPSGQTSDVPPYWFSWRYTEDIHKIYSENLFLRNYTTWWIIGLGKYIAPQCFFFVLVLFSLQVLQILAFRRCPCEAQCLFHVQTIHCVKSVRILSFSGPYFPAFGLNILRIQSECGKIWTRKTPNTDTFHPVTITRVDKFLSRCAILVARPIGHPKNGWSKRKFTSDRDTTRNIAFCF